MLGCAMLVTEHQTYHTYLFHSKQPTYLYIGAHEGVGQVSGPRSLVNDIRRLAYAVSVAPLLLSSCPSCSAIVGVIRNCSSDETGVEGFEWSLGLLTRTFGAS